MQFFTSFQLEVISSLVQGKIIITTPAKLLLECLRTECTNSGNIGKQYTLGVNVKIQQMKHMVPIIFPTLNSVLLCVEVTP